MNEHTEFWAIAADVCTNKELEALGYRAAGMGPKRIARELGLSTSTVKDRLWRARQKIDLERERRKAVA